MKKFLYHVSNPFFRETIKKEGLIAKIGPSYEAHYEDISNEPLEPSLFVTTKNNYNSTYNDDRYLIVLTNVEYEALDFKIDKEAKDSLYTKKSIPADSIILIHKGNGEDYDWDIGLDICNNLKFTPKKGVSSLL